MENKSQYPKAYAIQSKDKELLKRSSSGGVFGVLAHSVLAGGGVVFGAAFTEDFYGVRHIGVETREDLAKLHGSKYVLSHLGDAYQKVSAFIKEGREVLFVGTPCQISGLKKSLGRDYDHLHTCDLICHGTVSPKIFESYMKWLEKKYKSKIIEYSFRHKKNGWMMMTARARFKNGRVYTRRSDADPYFHAFQTGISLRAACGDCRLNAIPRQGDLSLGDFWGVEREKPQWFDDEGISVVVANTAKGENLLKKCREAFRLFEELDVAIPAKYNNIAKGTLLPKNNQDFHKAFEKEGFEAYRHFIRIPLKTKVREAVAPYLPRKVYQLFRKIF